MNIIINKMEGTEKQNAYAADIIRREFGVDLSDSFERVRIQESFAGLNSLEFFRVPAKVYRPFFRELTAEGLAELATEYTGKSSCRKVIDNKGCNVAKAVMEHLRATSCPLTRAQEMVIEYGIALNADGGLRATRQPSAEVIAAKEDIIAALKARA